MADPVRVMIQMRSTPSLAAAAFGPVAGVPALGLADIAGVQVDAAFSPVPIPPRPAAGEAGMGAAFRTPGPASYVVRATVQAEALPALRNHADGNPDVVKVF